MIVGSGMIAHAMENIDNDSLIFFCSGVAKSMETDTKEYQKEKQLLEKFYGTDQSIIYFSSYFVNFDSYLAQPYYQHKFEMESLIKENFEFFKVFRLPQVVGFSKNKHTLANFLFNAISKSETIDVYKNATRNLIDIDDIVKVVDYINRNNTFINQAANIIGSKNYSVEEIIECFENVIGNKAIKKVKEHQAVEIDIILSNEVTSIYEQLNISFDENYLEKVLRKYYIKGYHE